jgi:acetyltransferase-like isoleucine patch superfamily enzyme
MQIVAKTINKIAITLRKVADRLEKISVFSNEGLRGSINIHSSVKYNHRNICIKNNCIVHVDEQTQIAGTLIFDKDNAFISIGKRGFMNGTIIAAHSIEIGDDVLISWGTTIVDHNSHSISFSNRSSDAINWITGKKDWSHVKIAPIKICDKVWIGFNAIILKGVTIGEGAVVGAGSVVTKDVPPWTIVAGNPARVIREIPEDER